MALDYASIMGVFNAAMEVVKNVGEFGARYDHTRVVTFQQLWNNAVESGVISGASRLTPDGVYGPNTATALQSQLQSAGVPRIPATASLVPTWWNGVKAAVAYYASTTSAHLAAAIAANTPQNTTGDQAAATIQSATSAPAQTIADIGAQTSTRGPSGTATTAASGSAGGPIALPSEYITAPAPRRLGLSWPWVVGGVGLLTAAAWALYAAMRRRGAGKRRRSLRKA